MQEDHRDEAERHYIKERTRGYGDDAILSLAITTLAEDLNSNLLPAVRAKECR